MGDSLDIAKPALSERPILCWAEGAVKCLMFSLLLARGQPPMPTSSPISRQSPGAPLAHRRQTVGRRWQGSDGRNHPLENRHRLAHDQKGLALAFSKLTSRPRQGWLQFPAWSRTTLRNVATALIPQPTDSIFSLTKIYIRETIKMTVGTPLLLAAAAVVHKSQL